MPWLQDTWKYIREDQVQFYRWLMLVAPLAKTPMDKRGAQSLKSYSQKLERALENMTPWTKRSKFNALRRKYGKLMRETDSQVIVQLDANDDPNSQLFKDAVIAGSAPAENKKAKN